MYGKLCIALTMIFAVSIYSPSKDGLPLKYSQSSHALAELTDQEKADIVTLLTYTKRYPDPHKDDQGKSQIFKEMLVKLTQLGKDADILDIYDSEFSSLIQLISGKCQEKIISQDLAQANPELVAPAMTFISILLKLCYQTNHDSDIEEMRYDIQSAHHRYNTKLVNLLTNKTHELFSDKLHEAIVKLLAPCAICKAEISQSYILSVLLQLNHDFTRSAYIEYNHHLTAIPPSFAEELQQLDREQRNAERSIRSERSPITPKRDKQELKQAENSALQDILLDQKKKQDRELKIRSQFHSVSAI